MLGLVWSFTIASLTLWAALGINRLPVVGFCSWEGLRCSLMLEKGCVCRGRGRVLPHGLLLVLGLAGQAAAQCCAHYGYCQAPWQGVNHIHLFS